MTEWNTGSEPVADWTLSTVGLLFPILVVVNTCQKPYHTQSILYIPYILLFLICVSYLIYGVIDKILVLVVIYSVYGALVLTVLIFKNVRERSVEFLEQQILDAFKIKRELEHEFIIQPIDKYHVELVPRREERKLKQPRGKCNKCRNCPLYHKQDKKQWAIRDQRNYLHTKCKKFIISTKDQDWTIKCDMEKANTVKSNSSWFSCCKKKQPNKSNTPTKESVKEPSKKTCCKRQDSSEEDDSYDEEQKV